MKECYTLAEVLARLRLSRRTYSRLKKMGQLPDCIEELQPRIGGRARFRIEPIDRYMAGQWSRPRALVSRRLR